MNIKFKQKVLKTKRLSELSIGDAFEYKNDIYICLYNLTSNHRLAFNLILNSIDSFEDNQLVHPVTINATIEYQRAD